MLLFLLYFRFLGTTPKSSTILRVLKSIMLQIKHVYKFSAKIPRVSERFYNKLLPVIRKDFMLINENLRLKLILVYLLWVSKSVTLYMLLTIFTIIITINMIIGIIQLNHIIFDAPHVKFCVCHVSMLPQRNLYRHTFEDTRVHKIIQKRFSLFFIDWFFSVIKGRLSTVPKIFVQCYKRATIGDYAWLTGPTFSSTWCMEIKLVSKETSSSCEVHCLHTARSGIQVFSNIEGSVWNLYP